jgi:hypothetical protein
MLSARWLQNTLKVVFTNTLKLGKQKAEMSLKNLIMDGTDFTDERCGMLFIILL